MTADKATRSGQENSGLYGKYEVKKDGEPVEDCFVLEPERDDAALAALKEYAESTDSHQLAADLAEWIVEIEATDDTQKRTEEQ